MTNFNRSFTAKGDRVDSGSHAPRGTDRTITLTDYQMVDVALALRFHAFDLERTSGLIEDNDRIAYLIALANRFSPNV